MKRRSVLRGTGRGRTGALGRESAEKEPALGALRAKVLKLEKSTQQLRAANERLATERDQYEELYQLAPIPGLTLDVAYHVRRLNHAAAMLLGDLPDRVREQNFRVYVCAEDRQLFSQHIARAAGSSGLQRCRLRLQLAYDRRLPVEVWTRHFAPANSFEIRLVDLREHERMVEETRRLSAAERVAREESAAKDKFIAMLSHELRAPLTPVLAAASAQRAQPLSRELQDMFEMIERNIAAEARLIDDLLDVNRIVRNKMHVERVPVGVHQIVEQAVANLRPEADDKGQRIELSLDAQHDRALVDPARMRQVFSNLVKNAIKFSPEGKLIRIASWNAPSSLAIEVQDDGIGIEPDVMSRLFEPFNDERSTAAGGLGLGLTISKGLVELQGGRISAHSRGAGQGSRFVVELATTDAAAVPLKNAISTLPPPPSGERLSRILLVEDHGDTVEVLTMLLEQNGFQVRSATSLEAARQIDLDEVDVIVSDIGLPDGTGLDLMRELKVRGQRPSIALTGFGMESDVRASTAAGFDMHLTKPVSIERLVEAIHRLTRTDASLSSRA
jgi:signal transduction histidine kinase/ActR/RegA family two-component response regulator